MTTRLWNWLLNGVVLFSLYTHLNVLYTTNRRNRPAKWPARIIGFRRGCCISLQGSIFDCPLGVSNTRTKWHEQGWHFLRFPFYFFPSTRCKVLTGQAEKRRRVLSPLFFVLLFRSALVTGKNINKSFFCVVYLDIQLWCKTVIFRSCPGKKCCYVRCNSALLLLTIFASAINNSRMCSNVLISTLVWPMRKEGSCLLNNRN